MVVINGHGGHDARFACEVYAASQHGISARRGVLWNLLYVKKHRRRRFTIAAVLAR